MNKVILASASPRRKTLLEQAGFPCEVIPSRIEEETKKTLPQDIVMDLSSKKAEDVRERISKSGIIIGADTVVALGTEILGKPGNSAVAEKMLLKLQGKTHQVYTGVTILKKEHDQITFHKTFYDKTDVTFYPMTESEITEYVMEGESLDKAGGYAIQGVGALYIQEISGDYNNVVGLPISRIYQVMKEMDYDFSEPTARLRRVNNNSYRIRDIKETDIKKIAEIEAEFLSAHDVQELEELIKKFQTGRDSHYIAETVDGKIIGFCEGVSAAQIAFAKGVDPSAFDKDQREAFCRLFNIFVLPAYRRQGVGTALMFHACKVAKGQGKNSIMVGCEKKFIGFYRKLGFQRVGEPQMARGELMYHMNATF